MLRKNHDLYCHQQKKRPSSRSIRREFADASSLSDESMILNLDRFCVESKHHWLIPNKTLTRKTSENAHHQEETLKAHPFSSIKWSDLFQITGSWCILSRYTFRKVTWCDFTHMPNLIIVGNRQLKIRGFRASTKKRILQELLITPVIAKVNLIFSIAFPYLDPLTSHNSVSINPL